MYVQNLALLGTRKANVPRQVMKCAATKPQLPLDCTDACLGCKYRLSGAALSVIC